MDKDPHMLTLGIIPDTSTKKKVRMMLQRKVKLLRKKKLLRKLTSSALEEIGDCRLMCF